jgi:hypothetical protein
MNFAEASVLWIYCSYLVPLGLDLRVNVITDLFAVFQLLVHETSAFRVKNLYYEESVTLRAMKFRS